MRAIPGRFIRSGGVAAVLLGVLTAACGGDGSGPAPGLDGSYHLVAVGGNSLPYSYRNTPVGDSRVVGGTLRFRTRGRLSESRSIQGFNLMGQSMGEPITEDDVFSYEQRGDTLFIQRPTIPVTESYVDTGFVDPGGLRIREKRLTRFFVVTFELTYRRDP